MESVEGKITDIKTIFRINEFEKFYNSLNDKVRGKFEYTFGLVQTAYALPVKYVKHLDDTDLRNACILLALMHTGRRYYLQLITVMSYYQQR